MISAGEQIVWMFSLNTKISQMDNIVQIQLFWYVAWPHLIYVELRQIVPDLTHNWWLGL